MVKKTILLSVVVLLVARLAPAQERRVSIEQIAEAIEDHIARQSMANGGYFLVDHEGKTLRLQLVRVHMEYLADLGGGVQFACVDLVGTDGPVYDVDFFLSGDAGNMTVTETTVHKVNGQPLYAWEQSEDGTWVRVPVTDASPRLLGVIQGEDTFEFIYRVRLPDISGPAELWLPLAQSNADQQVEILDISAPSSWRVLTEKTNGNTVLYLTVGPEDSGETVEIQYRVRREEVSPYPVGDSQPERHLAPERLVPNDPIFRAIAEEAVKGKTTDLMRARALYDHVIDQIRYARYGSGWGRGDAVYACDAKSGNCTDFHSYFIALARAIDIPARFAIGAAIPSERDDGGIDGYHCWAEFYADDRWWPVDISEADKNSSLASYYFGHQPANRLELSRGRDLIVEPGPSSGPINFLAYAVLEVDGQPVPARTEFSFRRLIEHDASHDAGTRDQEGE
ncbi:MAG: hypothetical protein Kow0074_14290 [Candidatus Zixiibacteriota bacterium]